MINAHESGSNSAGAGTFLSTNTATPPRSDFTLALHMEKSISPLFPGLRGGGGGGGGGGGTGCK